MIESYPEFAKKYNILLSIQESNYYPSVYQNPQPQNIIIPQTQNIILSEKQPVINYTNYTPPLRLSKITNNSSYNKTTYKAYLKTPSKDIIYKNNFFRFITQKIFLLYFI